MPGQKATTSPPICIYSDDVQPGTVISPDREKVSWQCIGVLRPCLISSCPEGNGG